MKKLIAILSLVIGSAELMPTAVQASPERYRHDNDDSVEHRRVHRFTGHTRRSKIIVTSHRNRDMDHDYGYANGYHRRNADRVYIHKTSHYDDDGYTRRHHYND